MSLMLKELLDLQDKSKFYLESKLLNNEQASRNYLINPFLKTLGFIVEDYNHVNFEYLCGNEKGKKSRVDYALMFDNKPMIFIEAKAYKSSPFLGHVPKKQLDLYCQRSNVELFILTNGIDYWFFVRESWDALLHKPFYIFELNKITLYDLIILPMFSRSEFNIKNLPKIISKINRDKLNNVIDIALYKSLDVKTLPRYISGKKECKICMHTYYYCGCVDYKSYLRSNSTESITTHSSSKFEDVEPLSHKSVSDEIDLWN